VLEGIKMNSCACLLGPKKEPMCVVLVWQFGDGCFCERIINSFYNLSTWSTFFRFADLSSSAMGVVWNIYKGLSIWFMGGSLHVNKIATHD